MLFDNLEETLKNEEWKEYKLSDVAEYIRGITYSKHDECKSKEECELGIPVFRANNIDLETSSIQLEDLKYVNSDVKVNPKQRLTLNDILICAGSGSKEHIDKVAYIDNANYSKYLFGGFMGVIRVTKLDVLNPRFMFYLLKSHMFRDFLNNSLMTSTINNLSSSVMNNFSFLLPSISIQEKIADFLEMLTTPLTALIAALKTKEKKRTI